MKKFFIIALLFCCFASNAQRVYFLYLQAESGEPFFVRLNDKLYSSTATGYLIIPKLRDSSYEFRLGFPGKDLDLNFSTVIRNKDRGYLIKNFGEKGWGLFDMQSLNVQMASNPKSDIIQANNSQTQASPFTDLLSKASDDPSLKQPPAIMKTEEKKSEPVVMKEEKPVVVKEEKIEPPKDTVQVKEQKTDPIVAKEEPEIKKTEIKTEEKKPIQEEPYSRSQVSKIYANNISDGRQIVFVDEYAGKKDTIMIIVPAQKQEEEKKPVEEKKFLDISTEPDKTVTKTEEKQPEIKKEEVKIDKPATVVKNKCKSVAGENDFLKLRRKMAARTNDDGMMEEARKYFKSKCFTTEQIKNLSTMFLSNAGKYHFFDAAYEYVSDTENFPSLESELKDEYYLSRFKAMLKN